MDDCLQCVKILFQNCFNQQPPAGSFVRDGSIQSASRINDIQSHYGTSSRYNLVKDFGYSYDAISARNDRIRFPKVKTLDIIPKSRDVLNGDWILRYSDSEANNYPWSGDSSPSFDLVPWRRSKPNRNLLLAQSSFNSSKRWTNNNRDKKILERLHKIETKQVKKHLKESHKYSKRVKRIRIMLSIEMRQKSYEILPPKLLPRQFSEGGGKSHITRMAVVAVEEHEFRHWGYFSQRRNENFREKIAKEEAKVIDVITEQPAACSSPIGGGETAATDQLRAEIEQHVFCPNMNAVKTLNSSKPITPFAPRQLESDKMIVQMCRRCRARR